MLIHCLALFIVLFASAIHAENPINSLLEVNEKHEDDELGFDIHGFPSAIVNSCVNIISGEYQQTETDFSMGGALPFHIQRFYGGAGCKRHSLLYGWQINQGATLLSYQKDSFDCAVVRGSDRHGVFFKKYWLEETYVCPSAFFKQYVTNYSLGQMCAKTNFKNDRLWPTQEGFELETGDQSRYRFVKSSHDIEQEKGLRVYRLKELELPDGTSYAYSYSRLFGITTSASLYNQNKEKINHIKLAGDLTYAQFENHPEIIYLTASNEKVTYRFMLYGNLFDRRAVLTEVERPHAPKIQYSYETIHGHYKQLRLTKRELPDQRVLKISYDAQDRVRKLISPAGPGNQFVTTHLFTYLQNGNDCSGCVENGLGGIKCYRWHHQTKRLNSIVTYGKNDQLIQKERFGWGDPKHDQSHLTAHVIEDENGQLISYQKYEYDTFGNRTRLSLYGNLTGETKGNISIGKDFAIPSKDSCDALHIVSRYDNRNRKIAEDDGRILNEYTYVGNSDLVAAHYISYEGRIQKRHFYRYDPSRAVSQEIIDDSSSLEASNLANVSQRFIKEIKNSSTGIPEIAEEYAFDIPLNKKILIRKTVDVYDSHGWIISRSIYGSDDLLSHTLEWQYDSHGNVIYYKNALGDVTISQYDANDNLIYEKMPDIAPRFMTYDCMNRLISEEERDPNGESLFKTYAYDVMGNQTSFTDIYGNTTFYDYDEHERLIRVRLPPMKNGTCPTIAYTRNALDLPSSIKDPNGHVTLIEYNLRGMPICTTYPDGTTERCEYTVWDELKRSIGPDGTEIRYTYDPQGRETKQEWFDVKGNLLRFTTKTYNAFHLISETDANGIETSYTYDSAGRLIAKKTDQRVTKYAYDAMGRQTTVSKYLENGSYISDEKRYDTANRVIEQYTLDSHGKIYQREIKHYNGQGNEIQCLRWNQAGKAVTTIDYDLFRREVRSTDPLGNSTYTAYHVEGRARKEVTNPLGVKEVTTYDPLSRPILEQRFDSFGKLVKEVSYEYDPNGNQILTSVTTQKRPIETRWQYDEMNRLTTIIDAAGTQKQRTLQHAYDAAGRLITLTKNDGTTLHYTYDPLGRLIQLKSSDGTVFYKYRYDKNDQLLTARDKVNKTSFTRQYDIYDQMIEEAFPHGNVMRYSYDLIGRTKQLILPDQTSISYHYKGHTLASINRKGALSYQHNYTAYDSSCNPTRMQLAGQAGLLSIDYDLLNRPIKMNVRDWKETLEYHAHLLKKRMTHDSFGEADSTYTYDACDQLLSEKGNAEHTFKYDWQGNPIAHNGNKRQFDSFNALMKDGSRQYTYDQNGNRTCDGVNTYRYDALNRLIEVKTPKTAVRYIYDALDRRIAKIEGKKKTRYLWQNQQEIGTISSKGKIRELKVLAPLNRPVAFELQGAVYAPLTDTFGNVRALLDSSGKPFATYRYSAFGEEQQRGEAISPWRYAGKRADPETALVYFGKRYYDPKTLCWLTPDPLHHADGPNLYTYVHNNPLRYIDPNGLFAIAVPVILEVFTITWGSIEAAIASWVTIETVAATAVTVAAGAAVAHGINSIDATQDVKSDENQDISKKAKKKRNGNPFDGPVDEDVMLIDSAGNAIPIKSGQKAAGSRDGNWIQVEDSKGLPTGLRKDGPHNPNRHKDPRALKPHAHVPEINNLDGTPWLPIKY